MLTTHRQLSPPRRLPFEPLEQLVAGRIARLRAERKGVLTLLGESGSRYYYRARHNGYVSDLVADRICVTRLRVHPADVWGATWFEGQPIAPNRSPRPPLPQDLVGIRAVGRICSVPLSTVRDWTASGKLAYVTRYCSPNYGQRLYRRSDLEALTAAS